MRDLNFRDRLERDLWSSHNDYDYENLREGAVLFKEGATLPFFMYYSPLVKDKTVFAYSNSTQFKGRTVTLSRAKQIINGAKVPLKVKMGPKNYLMCKGFIAHINSEEKIKPLFVAGAKKKPTDIKDIIFYVASEVYHSDRYVGIRTLISDTIFEHTGEVLITQYIEEYFGSKIEAPKARTIREQAQFSEQIIERALEKVKQIV